MAYISLAFLEGSLENEIPKRASPRCKLHSSIEVSKHLLGCRAHHSSGRESATWPFEGRRYLEPETATKYKVNRRYLT